MNSTLLAWLKTLSRLCGFDTADSFPPNHPHARTRWNGAYFDIASDVPPDEIERRLCGAIDSTPVVFAQIENPTPRMQRALLNLIEARVRRRIKTHDLVHLLVDAYGSPHIKEVIPGLRDVIRQTEHDDKDTQARAVLAFLAQTQSLDVFELRD